MLAPLYLDVGWVDSGDAPLRPDLAINADDVALAPRHDETIVHQFWGIGIVKEVAALHLSNVSSSGIFAHVESKGG